MRLVTKTLAGERPRSAWTDLSAYGSSRNHTLPSLSPSYPHLFVSHHKPSRLPTRIRTGGHLLLVCKTPTWPSPSYLVIKASTATNLSRRSLSSSQPIQRAGQVGKGRRSSSERDSE